MLSQDAPADSLLERDPLALLLAMLLDQQVPMERAFAAPYELQQRLGHDLDVQELADYDAVALADLFARPPALHRYPKAMAGRVQDLCRGLVEHYDGDVTG
ncbi:MAG: HhH-GPD-type base excision DNA repair protein, partial [Pseudonocardiaceae bacterium]